MTTKYVKAIPQVVGEYTLYPSEYGFNYTFREEISWQASGVLFPLMGMPDNHTLYCLSSSERKVVWMWFHDSKVYVVSLIK